MILVRATQLDVFMRAVRNERKAKNSEERYTFDDVRASIVGWEGNRATRLGTAFHGFLSYPDRYIRKGADQNNYFIYEFPDHGPDGKLPRYISQKIEVMEPLVEVFRPVRELGALEIREYKHYDIGEGLTLTGEVDGLLGLEIAEIKTTGYINYERYETSEQKWVYMDLLGADLIRYHVFAMREGRPPFFTFLKYESFTFERYPDLSQELKYKLTLFWDWVKDEPELLQLLIQKASDYEKSK